MQKDRKIENLAAEDLEALTAAQTEWGGVAVDPSSEEDDEILEAALGIEAQDEDDVIGEDDDNPYQESDEALPDDEEERGMTQWLRRQEGGVSEA